MVKPLSRPISQYSLDALVLMGQLIREARLTKGITSNDLAERAGISRSLLQRIEQGDPGSSIGVVFEVAAICRVPLFDFEKRQLSSQLVMQQEKMRLLPKSVRVKTIAVKDDF